MQALPLILFCTGVGSAVRVNHLSDAWMEPLIMWAALVGFPAQGKTPHYNIVFNAFRDALRRVDELRSASITVPEDEEDQIGENIEHTPVTGGKRRGAGSGSKKKKQRLLEDILVFLSFIDQAGTRLTERR
jgi:hypothetical protein